MGDFFNTSGPNTTLNSTTTTPVTSSAQTTTEDFSSTTAQSVTNSTTFDQNALGLYANPTYHIRFLTAGDQNYQTNPTLTTVVVLAESGVTGYNIASFTLESWANPNSKTRTTIGTNYTLVITEALGTSFLDALYAAGQQTQSSNFQKQPYYIEISFKGYNEDGSPNTNLCSNFPNGGVWRYQVAINDIGVHFDATGGQYTITGIIFAQTALDDPVLRTQEAYSIPATTIGDFFTSLASSLNKLVQTKNGSQLITYSFDFQTTAQNIDPKTFTFIESSDDAKNSFRMRPINEADKTKFAANIPSGTAITDIISDALGSTRQGQNLAKDYTGKATDDSYGDGTYRAAGIFKIYPEVQLNGYDYARSLYRINVIFHVKMSVQQGNYLKPEEVTNTANSKTALQTIQSLNGLVKRYDYIYTGLNTEVESFDIDFHLSWTAILPRFQGVYNFNENYEPHATFNALQRNAVQTVEQQNAADQQAAAVAQQAANQSLTNPLSTNLSNGFGAIATDSSGQTILNGVSVPTTLTGTPSTSTFTSLSTSTSPTTTAAALSSTTTATNPLVSYAEDIVTQATVNPFQISFAQSYNGPKNAAGVGFVGPWDKRKSVFGFIMNQVNLTNGSFLNITLGIKGDPYWLGLDYPTMIASGSQNAIGQPSDQGGALADYSIGSVCFCLYFQYPYTTGDDGSLQFAANKTFNGVYQVTKITNTFSNGLFKQTLEANRVNNITPEDSNSIAKS